jgi:ribosomal-protein-alanine N-acetyltransferase
MNESDLDAVMKIEHTAFEFPWTKGIFADCLRSDYWCRVLEKSGQMVGYGVMMVAAGEAHILNITVAQAFRSGGLGGEMLDAMLIAARRLAVQSVFLEVRPSNQSAIRLYERRGFVEIGMRPGYYPARQGREDALLMAKEIQGSHFCA